MKRILISLMGAMMLQSCANAENRNPQGSNRTPRTPFSSPYESRSLDGCRVGANEDAFKCAENRCEQLGGKFDAVTKDCDCGRGKIFVGWGKGACWDLDAVQSSNVIFVPEESRPRTDSLVRLKKQQPLLFNSYTAEWVTDREYFQSLSTPRIIEMTAPFRLSLTSVRDIESTYQTFFVPTEAELDAAVHLGSLEGRIQLPEPRAKHPTLERIQKLANSVLSQRFAGRMLSQFTEDGCAGHCELSQEFDTPEGSATWFRRYLGGKRFSDHIYLWNDSTREMAFADIVLLPSGQVSHILTSMPYEEDGESGVRMEMWDRSFQPLLKSSIKRQVIADRSILDRATEALLPWNRATNLPSAVVCESGFSPKTLEALDNDYVVTGPIEKSVFGWVKGEEMSPYALSGLLPLDPLGMRVPFADYEGHARRVSLIVQGDYQKVAVLPVGASECASSASRWLPTVREKTRARVVNFSAVMDYSREMCPSSPVGKMVSENPDFLFVTAAGNDGGEMSSATAKLCPQAISGSKNLIVTAAGSSGGPSMASNFGTDYADILADGFHSESGQQMQATSFASPRVARVAALIHQRYSRLNPEQIRQAILLSVNIPKDAWGYLRPLPVRSGGVLNELKALEVAQIISENPRFTVKEILKKTYCYWGECHEQQIKEELYQ